MKTADLLALLQAENQEVGEISAGIDTLLTAIQNGTVSQDVADAANAVKASLDAAKAKFGTQNPNP